ncbi:MAG TPA: hypothetical protein P5077_13035 [bacterium]|nr:hypothetical protein [bacterium]
MRILAFLCSLMLCGSLSAEATAPAVPAKPAPAPEKYSLTIVQYEVSAVPCAAEGPMMEAIVKKAGYACAAQKGRITINLTGAEAQKVTDFMNKEITVAVEGKKENYLLVRVKIPGEMDAVFMPVIGGSFVAGYDLDEKKTKGVLLLIYVV